MAHSTAHGCLSCGTHHHICAAGVHFSDCGFHHLARGQLLLEALAPILLPLLASQIHSNEQPLASGRAGEHLWGGGNKNEGCVLRETNIIQFPPLLKSSYYQLICSASYMEIMVEYTLLKQGL